MIIVALAALALVQQPLKSQAFTDAAAGEAVAVISASCARCDWGVEGREAAALRVSLDGQYSQHVVLARGERQSDYRITLGHVSAGRHRLDISLDSSLSAKDIGEVNVASATALVLAGGSGHERAP